MIERDGKKKMLLFSGSSNAELADKVAKELGTELAEVDKTQFANGEISYVYKKAFEVPIVL